MPLSPKHQRFVAEYLKDQNATQAAIRAGYSEKTAQKNAARLTANEGIKGAIVASLVRATEKAELKAADVLEEIRLVAFQRASMYFDEKGALLPIHKLPASADASLADHEVVTGNVDAGDGKRDRIVKLKKWSKTAALSDLAKHFGLLLEKVEHTGGLEITWKTTE